MQQFNATKLQELDHLFRKTVRRFVKERDKITIQGVSLPSMMILRKIFIYGEQRLSDLAEEMDLTSGAITAQCDKLEEQGLAERIRHKEDRRTIYLQITAQGRAFVECYHDIGHAHANIIFEHFTEEELEQQFVIYQKLLDNLQGLSDKLLAVAKISQQQAQVIQQAEQSSKAIDMANEEQTLKAAGLISEERLITATEQTNEDQLAKAAETASKGQASIGAGLSTKGVIATEKLTTEAIAKGKITAAAEKQTTADIQQASTETAADAQQASAKTAVDAQRASAKTATDEQRGRWLSY